MRDHALVSNSTGTPVPSSDCVFGPSGAYQTETHRRSPPPGTLGTGGFVVPRNRVKHSAYSRPCIGTHGFDGLRAEFPWEMGRTSLTEGEAARSRRMTSL